METVFELFRRNGNKLIACLVGVIFLNFMVQFYTHKTTGLISWKGGGFGMYTEPHVINRSLWVEFEEDGETRHFRLAPKPPKRSDVVVDSNVSDFNALVTRADRFRFFPTERGANKVLDAIRAMQWKDDLNGMSESTSVYILENRSDLKSKTITRSVIFKSGLGGA